jgi:hypothetical protein
MATNSGDRRLLAAAAHVLARRRLEVQRADAIGARLSQVGEPAEITDPGIAAGEPVEDDPLAPAVGSGVVQASRDLQAVGRVNESTIAERKLGVEERDRVIATAIPVAVSEVHETPSLDRHAGSNRVLGARQPDPHVRLRSQGRLPARHPRERGGR